MKTREINSARLIEIVPPQMGTARACPARPCRGASRVVVAVVATASVVVLYYVAVSIFRKLIAFILRVLLNENVSPGIVFCFPHLQASGVSLRFNSRLGGQPNSGHNLAM